MATNIAEARFSSNFLDVEINVTGAGSAVPGPFGNQLLPPGAGLTTQLANTSSSTGAQAESTNPFSAEETESEKNQSVS